MNPQQNQIAAIYCRLSKEDVDKAKTGDDSESIQNQKLMLLDYALANGFLVHNVYVDEDMSGFADRPEFKRMIKDAEKGLFNTIICKQQSRFTRDMELVEKYIHGLFLQWGIRFIGLVDNVDTNVKGNKKARQIYGLINEWYSEDLSENIKAVLKKKRENGQFISAFTSYGYLRCNKDRNKIVIDEDAAEIVKEIFNLFLDGYGLSTIATILTSRGIPTPEQHKRMRGVRYRSTCDGKFVISIGHGAWVGSTIKNILANEFYIGTLVQGKTKKMSYKSKKQLPLPREQWSIIENNHEAIIPKEIFYKVQALRDGRRKRYQRKTSTDEMTRPHMFSGRLVCMECGSTMRTSGLTRNKSSRYMKCTLAVRTRMTKCANQNIRFDEIEDIVTEELRTLVNRLVDRKMAQEIEHDVSNTLSAEYLDRMSIEKQIEDAKSKVEQLQTKIVLAYTDKLDGLISDENFILFKESFEEEQKIHKNTMQHLESKLLATMSNQKTTEQVISVTLDFFNNGTLTHRLVNDLIDQIFIGKAGDNGSNRKVVIRWSI